MKQKRFVIESPVRSFATGAVLAAAVAGLLFAGPAGAQSGSGQAATMQSAWALYTKNQFKESAESFEEVLKTSKPNPRLYYYAAMANFRSNKRARARQLCQYIVQHFAGTTEAVHSAKMFPELASAAKTSTSEGASSGGTSSSAGTTTASAASASAASGSQELNESNLPAEFWAAIPTDMKKKIKDPSVQAALRGSFKDYQKKMGVTESDSKKGDKKGGKTKTVVASTSGMQYLPESAKFKIDNTMRRGQYPFTAADIARDGANAIDQNINPNCWFEASMASLAELPRGQRLLASMIRYGGPDTYIVRFPRDGVEYKITEEQMKSQGINDRALWASLIECAQVMKFPNNQGANGATGDESRLAIGLGCITGCKAEILYPGDAGLGQISSFIAGAVSSKNPIVCSTWDDPRLPSPQLVVGLHAYTIIGFDPASKLVTIRNPHGKNSDIFSLPSDPRHEKFQMMDNGVFKMHLSIFQKSFYQVCRSFI
ncbi:MAG: hypothetical protein AB7W16_09170 [Candidatus Obscuribacterales bacterium]